MNSRWTRYCRANDIAIDGTDVVVTFSDERHHRITVEEKDDCFVLCAFVVRQRVVSKLRDLPIQIWLRNRSVSLVGFRIDRKGRLVGEAWVPKAGLTAEEFQLYVRTVAVECDRFEYILTGQDVE